jgi:hypothetical protein
MGDRMTGGEYDPDWDLLPNPSQLDPCIAKHESEVQLNSSREISYTAATTKPEIFHEL